MRYTASVFEIPPWKRARRKFVNLANSVAALQYRVFVIFFVTVIPAIIMSQIESMFIMSRMTYIREASSKMYSLVVFALSQLAAEMPHSILCSVVFFLLLYYPAGFNMESTRAGYAFAMILLTELFAVTIPIAIVTRHSGLRHASLAL
ncbi:hypothetical protein JCM3770_002194 [Rhodotorula araucariae]